MGFVSFQEDIIERLNSDSHLYRANRGTSSGNVKVDKKSETKTISYDLHLNILTKCKNEIKAKTEEIKAKEKEIRAREEEIKIKENQIELNDYENQECLEIIKEEVTHQLQSKDTKIQNLEFLITEKDEFIIELRRRVDELEKENFDLKKDKDYLMEQVQDKLYVAHLPPLNPTKATVNKNTKLNIDALKEKWGKKF